MKKRTSYALLSWYSQLCILSALSFIITSCGDPLPSLPLDATVVDESDMITVDETDASIDVNEMNVSEEDATVSEEIGFCQECESSDDCPSDFTCFTHAASDEQFCSKTCASDDECPSDYRCGESSSQAEAGSEAGSEVNADAGDDTPDILTLYCVPTEGRCSPVLCRDEDNDGYGRGPDCLGLDCADDNPEIHEGVQDLCDNVDNDCDGLFDEDFVPTACGDGICAGMSICDAGRVSCDGPQAMGEDANCNNLDEDCDGQIDEGYQSISCGLGACSQPSICVDGAEQCTGSEAPMGDEDLLCDRVDSDCDGVIDEGYVTTASTCGLGVCESRGSCSDQGEQCTPTPTLGTDTDCNGRDDDCDGRIDEGFTSNIFCGVGACRQQQSCVDGNVMCVIGSPIGVDNTCDEIDDDCDGVVDDECAALGLQVGFSLIENTPAAVEIAITFSGLANSDGSNMPEVFGVHFTYPSSLTIHTTTVGQAFNGSNDFNYEDINIINEGVAGQANFRVPSNQNLPGFNYVPAGELMRIRFIKTDSSVALNFSWVDNPVNGASAVNTELGLLEVTFLNAEF